MPAQKKTNILLIAIDSLRADRLSCYGYPRLTTPHMDHFATQGVLFENTFSAHIPTTSAYASMLTGMDCFSTQVVALRHKGGLRPEVKTLAEVLRGMGYQVKINDPYKGVELVRAFSDPKSQRHSLQVEVNKRLYMDENERSKSSGYAALRANLTRLIEAIRDYAAAAARRAK